MFGNNKVVWKEGMFLQPQHFQQQERYLLSFIDMRLRSVFPYCYGVLGITIDKDAINNGIFNLRQCNGILPDGTCFSIPKDEPAPAARQFTDHFAHDQTFLDVFLALPLQHAGKTNIVSASAENLSDVRYRSSIVTITDEVRGDQRKDIEIGLSNFTILFGDESLDNHSIIRIARLSRNSSGQIELMESFIPPLLQIGGSQYLMNQIRGLLEVLLAKHVSLSQGRRQIEGGFADFSSSEETAFRLLQIINTYTPLLNHYHFAPSVHPYELFCLLTQLCGALCTFSTRHSLKNLPRYEHLELSATFGEFVKIIRSILSADISAACVVMAVEKIAQATYLCKVTDEKLFSGAQFYLGISANASEKELIVGVAQRVKMSSRGNLDLLISSALPGLQLIHAANPPEGLSTKPTFVYFKLNQSGDFWNNIKATREIAFYFPNNFQNLQMEILALKQ